MYLRATRCRLEVAACEARIVHSLPTFFSSGQAMSFTIVSVKSDVDSLVRLACGPV